MHRLLMDVLLASDLTRSISALTNVWDFKATSHFITSINQPAANTWDTNLEVDAI